MCFLARQETPIWSTDLKFGIEITSCRFYGVCEFLYGYVQYYLLNLLFKQLLVRKYLYFLNDIV